MKDPLFARLGRQYAAGSVLVREGDRGHEMFVVRSGRVRISKEISGASRPLAVLGPGEFFGEMAILNGKPRTATATAIEDVSCLVIEAESLEAMLAKNSEIALRLIKKLSRRLASADQLVEIFMHTDPKARVMLALARHAEAFGEVTDEGVVVRTSTTELAREIALEPEIVAEVIERLTSLDLARQRDSAIVIADVDRLQDFIEFLEMPATGDEG